MFSRKNPETAARKEFEAHYQMARKVYDYRQDLMSPKDRERYSGLLQRMKVLLKDKTSVAVEGMGVLQNDVEPLIRKYGKHFYPRHFLAENTEMLLFAAILAIAVRSFFFQPFKIPTNSMYPSYNGMTAAVFTEQSPAAPLRVVRWLALGASHQRLVSPVSGELVFVDDAPRLIPTRKWLVLPSQKLRYTFYVGEAPLYLDVPLQFDVRLILEPLFAGRELQRTVLPTGQRGIRSGIHVKRGELAFAVDVLTGDQLFVDRMSYHFIRPKVGDPIVFRTDNIEYMGPQERDKYYIKRAVAGPGDELEIEPPDLILNGAPISGARAFAANRAQQAPFTGYVRVAPSAAYPFPLYGGNRPIEVPEGHYFAMGDNSPNSADSRMWGFVPQREIVGRALFVYYPFHDHWGIAR